MLQAVPGSRHGYDVVDHSHFSGELGGEAGYERLREALRARGMGQVLDVVPNHMAISGRLNRWWWDVLENGASSRYATYFDITWDPHEAKLRNTILLPVLDDHYGRVLEAGRFRLEHENGRLLLRYLEHEFPIDPRTYGTVLGDGFGEIAARFASLPVPAPGDRPGALRRHLEKEVLLQRLVRLDSGAELAVRVRVFSADVDRLDALIEQQNYRLARWQTAGFELDYRRFFDDNSLVALRMEDPDVFADTHVRLLEELHSGTADGVRVDHPDGLRDPLGYLRRLRRAAPGAWIVVEKVLHHHERAPEDWPVAGTTGYEFLNRVTGLLVDPAGEGGLTEAWVGFTGQAERFPDTVYSSKHLVMRELLASDVSQLIATFARVCEGSRRHRDFTRYELGECLREAIACLPVYRVYTRPGEPASRSDRALLESALADARRRRPDLDPQLLDFLREILLGQQGGDSGALVERFHQVSAPVAAKGVEDTALYRNHRLVALNEIGGDPARFGVSPDEFHAACVLVAERWPDAMLTTSTHDTKRGEDVRARLAVLSEMPGAWSAAVQRWAAINERHRRAGLPDRSAEYLLYQTLVGAWPISVERVAAYMLKAVREAKIHTSWIHPDPAYERGVQGFVTGALADAEFIGDLESFLPPLLEAGTVNSLVMKLLCLTAPGVPDVYQGSELWDLTLVDPDNRRPVDFAHRRRLLDRLDALGHGAGGTAWAERETGLAKLLVVSRALRLRADRPELFTRATYEPLQVRGAHAARALVFCRGGGAVTVVPRLALGLADGWADTAVELPAGSWADRFTGRATAGRAELGDLLSEFPVALLERQEA